MLFFVAASFIIQFFILSLLIGIPLFTLHMCLGQVLESGPVDMWRISPIFQGVGVSLLITQAVIGMYSIIGLSWIFVYFRDSFITSNDRYKWALPHEFNLEGEIYLFTLSIPWINEVFHQRIIILQCRKRHWRSSIQAIITSAVAIQLGTLCCYWNSFYCRCRNEERYL